MSSAHSSPSTGHYQHSRLGSARPTDHVEQSILAVREVRSLYEGERQEAMMLRDALQQKETEVNSAWEVIERERAKCSQLSEQLARARSEAEGQRAALDLLQRNSQAAIEESSSLALENQRLKVQVRQLVEERTRLKDVAESRAKDLASLSVAKVKLDQQCSRMQGELAALREQTSASAEMRARAEREGDVERAHLRDAAQELRDNLSVAQAALLSKERENAVLRDAKESLAAQLQEKEAQAAKLSATIAEQRLQLREAEEQRASRLSDSLSATERKMAQMTLLLEEKSAQQSAALNEATERIQSLSGRILELDVENQQLRHQCDALRVDHKQLSLASHFATSKAQLLQEALESSAAEVERLREESLRAEHSVRSDALTTDGLQQTLRREQEKLVAAEKELHRVREVQTQQARELVFSQSAAEILQEEKSALAAELEQLGGKLQKSEKEASALQAKLQEARRDAVETQAAHDEEQRVLTSAKTAFAGEVDVLRARVEAMTREKESTGRLHAQELADATRRHEEAMEAQRAAHATTEGELRVALQREHSSHEEALSAAHQRAEEALRDRDAAAARVCLAEAQVSEIREQLDVAKAAARTAELKAGDDTMQLQLRVAELEQQNSQLHSVHEKELLMMRRAAEQQQHHKELDQRRTEMDRVALERQHGNELAALRQDLEMALREAVSRKELECRESAENELATRLEKVRAAHEAERTELLAAHHRSKEQMRAEIDAARHSDEQSVAAATRSITELHERVDRTSAMLLERERELQAATRELERVKTQHRREADALELHIAALSQQQLDSCGHVETAQRETLVAMSDAERQVLELTLQQARDAVAREQLAALHEVVERQRAEAETLRHRLAAASSTTPPPPPPQPQPQPQPVFPPPLATSTRQKLLEHLWELYAKTVSTRRVLRSAFQYEGWRSLVERRLIDDELGNSLCVVVEGVQWSHDRLQHVMDEIFTDEERSHVETSMYFVRETLPVSPAPQKSWRRDPSPPTRSPSGAMLLQSPRRHYDPQ